MSFELKDLKSAYLVYEKKYKLPSFKKVNGYFEIDKIDKEGDAFLRIVRKVGMEKIVNSLSFLDMLINPVNAPPIYHSYIKGMSVDDRKTIDEIYKVLGTLSIESIGMELDYNEKEEAEFIIKLTKSWEDLKSKFKIIMDNMKKPNSLGERREKAYFG